MNLVFDLYFQVIGIVIGDQKGEFIGKIIELINAQTKPFAQITHVLNISRLEDLTQVLKVVNRIQDLAFEYLPLLDV